MLLDDAVMKIMPF